MSENMQSMDPNETTQSGRMERKGFGRGFLVATAIAAAAFGAPVFAQGGKGLDSLGLDEIAQTTPEDGSELVTMRVLLTPRVMFPDNPAVVAVVFDIEPGWHLYWKNSGDTGMPISLSFTLPEGITTGKHYWPGPKRYPMPGGMLDYIYEDQVVLFVALEGEGGDRTTIDLTVNAEWLVCKEACLPGRASVQTTFVAGSRVSKEDEEMLDRHLSRLAFPMHPRASLTWNETTLEVRVPNASGLVFFPEFDRNARPINILRDGEAAGPELTIPFDSRVKQADRVRGVLEIRNRSGRSAFYEVDIAPPL